jgi:hypothetical protein
VRHGKEFTPPFVQISSANRKELAWSQPGFIIGRFATAPSEAEQVDPQIRHCAVASEQTKRCNGVFFPNASMREESRGLPLHSPIDRRARKPDQTLLEGDAIAKHRSLGQD